MALVQKARGHRGIRTTLVYTQVVVDPRLNDAVHEAFTLRSKSRLRVAPSRGMGAKQLVTIAFMPSLAASAAEGHRFESCRAHQHHL